jgi:hypothetical protein
MPREKMKRRLTIIVQAAHAKMVEIGEDCASLGRPGYIAEKNGPEFTDSKGLQMVEVTLLERTRE